MKPKPGQRVAHRSLENEEGSARSGVAVDVVGDDKQSLIIVEGEEGREAFDTREMISLGPAGRSAGPVVLRPAHLKAALRRSQRVLAIVLALVLIAALVVAGLVFGLSGKPLFALAGAVLALGAILIVALEYDAQRERGKSTGR